MHSTNRIQHVGDAHFITIAQARKLAEDTSTAACNALGANVEQVLTREFRAVAAGAGQIAAAHMQLAARVAYLESRTLRGRWMRFVSWLRTLVQRLRQSPESVSPDAPSDPPDIPRAET